MNSPTINSPTINSPKVNSLIRLHANNVTKLVTQDERPAYDFEHTGTGIVHLGVGAFHRAHQAVFTDDAMALSGGNWRIIGVSLRSAAVAEQLNPQDGLYSVVEQQGEQSKKRIIGAISHVLVAPDSPQAVIDEMADANTHLLTITVTEKGYHYDLVADGLQQNSPDIVHDIACPMRPKSMPGFIVAACIQRMQQALDTPENGAHKLSIISCDNLPDNGEITRKVVLQLAAYSGPRLVDWINENVSFCSSMVDRIVPAMDSATKASLALDNGYEDEAVVKTEPFKQWVIQDNFCTPRPNWEAAGVLITKDVTSFETMKLRTLNGAHSFLAYAGALLGYEYIHQAISDPMLHALSLRMMQQESGKTLTVAQGFDLQAYQLQVIARFANSGIAYRTQQVASDGSQKLTQRILAPIQALLLAKDLQQASVLIATLAAWLRYLQGQDEMGNEYDINDPLSSSLCSMLDKHWANPQALVKALHTELRILPQALLQNEMFVSSLVTALESIQTKGFKAYLASL